MINFYKKLDRDHKGLFILAVIDIVIFLVLLPLGFIKTSNGFNWWSLSIGWLIGSIAQLIGYGSIIFFSAIIMNPNIKSNALKAVAPLTFFIRFGLYAGVLVISGISTFKSEWFGGLDIFNFVSCLIPLVFLSFYAMGAKIFELKAMGEPTKKEANE